MRRFICGHCSMSVVTDADPGEIMICPNCDTRQEVPASAVDEPLITVVNKPASASQGVVRPPRYSATEIIAVLLIILGCIQCFVAWVNALDSGSLISWLGVVSGTPIIAFGLVILLLRDIAIEVWHIRHSQLISRR